MKHLLPWLIVLAACGNDNPKPVTAALISEEEVKAFIVAYDRAWEDRDTIAMRTMMDEKYLYFSSTGGTISRGQIFGWFKPADKYRIDSAARDSIVITLHGNTAIVSSHWVGSGSFGTETFNDDQRCGLVVQKMNGVLKLVSEHCSQIVR